MSRAWKVILSVLLVLVAGAFVLVAMTGVVPGVSSLVGANQPRDLGVQATTADYDRVVQDMNSLFKPAPAAGKATPQKIDREFTEAELSALLTYSTDSEWPVQKGQVRIHADGTLEMALAVITQKLPADLLQHMPRPLPDVVPMYVKGNLGIGGPNEVRLSVQRLELGRIPIPSSLVGQLDLAAFINDELRSTPGLTLQNLVFSEGKVRVQGTYVPSK